MKKNILTALIVMGFLGVIGADAYLVFTQVFGPILPVITSIIITVILTLFVSHLMSKVKFKDKDIDINQEDKTITI